VAKLLDDGLQIWTDYEAAGGTHLHTIAGAEELQDFVTVNGREELTLRLPRNDVAWDDIAKRKVIRVEFDDGTIDEYRIARFDELHSTRQYTGEVIGEGAIMEMNGPGLCELVYDSGDVVQAFELLGMTVDDYLDEVILPAGPSWITKGTVDPTDLVDLTYEHFTPLRALQALLDATGTERHLIRQAGGAYEINVLDQRGGAASVPVIQLGKNLRSSARETDDRETRTRIYPVGVESEEGQARLQDARFEVTARDLGADTVVMEITQRDRTIKAAWQDDALDGFYIGNPDGTQLQEILSSVNSTGKVEVADASLYAVGEELQFYETAAGKRLAFLEDQDQTSSDTDRRPESIVYNDVPPARNLIPNPRLDAYTGGNPDDWSDVGTPTTVAETTAFEFRDIGSASLQVICNAADEGVECDAVTIVPTDDNPYFTAYVKIWIASGRVRLQLDHSVIGIFPPLEAGDDRLGLATSSVTGRWVELIIQPGTENLLPAGTVNLQVLSEGDAAEFYVDGAMLTQTASLMPFTDGQPAVELWDRAAQRFLGELVSTEVTRYTLGVADLSDLVLPFDALTVGGDVELEDPDLGIDVTTRMKSLRRDLLRPAMVSMELDKLRGRFTETAIRRRRRRRVDTNVEETLTLSNLLLDLDAGDGSLRIVFNSSIGVAAVKYDTSTSAQPTRADAIAGTSVAITTRSSRVVTSLQFTPGDTLFVTIVPTSSTGATGKQGPTYELSINVPPRGPQVTAIELLIDETDGDVLMRIELNEEVASIRYATAVGATPAWMSDATVEAGTIVNGTGSIDVLLGAATISAGETLRVRVAPYNLVDGLGPIAGATEHGPIAANEKAWRPQRGAITHKIRIPFADILPLQDTNDWGVVDSPNFLHPGVASAAQAFYSALVMPAGVTITDVSFRGYRQTTDDSIDVLFKRVDDDGAPTTLATLAHDTTGWQTKSASISEVVGASLMYVFRLLLFSDAAATDSRHLWFEVEYTRADDVNDSY
jgi:hypothetical protein